MTKKTTFNLVFSAILTSLALALSFFESVVCGPLLPIPGIKLGLSNIVILFALYTLSPKSAFSVSIIKCILSSVFGGGPVSFIFSISGSLLAFFVMIITKRSSAFSIYGVSVLGAASHSIGQILAATVFFSFSVISYLPLMLLASVITGILVAFIAQFLILCFDRMYKK